MAKPFIAVRKSKGIEYASICTPARVNGKKVNNPIYLGRVIDLKAGKFRSKARGDFIYTIKDGFSYPEPDAQEKTEVMKGSLCFGHVYCVHALLERTGLLKLFRETGGSSPDTLLSLLMHRLLDNYDDFHAKAFFDQTYTKILYPKAKLSPQEISRYLKTLGTEANRRDFHKKYIPMMSSKENISGILFDNNSLNNNINCPITEFSNNVSIPINETRLIYVLDKNTISPIYFKAFPGTISDAILDIEHLGKTIDELKALKVNITKLVIDESSENNLEGLFNLGIHFITRLISKSVQYNELIEKNRDTVMKAENHIIYKNQVMFMTTNEIKLAKKLRAYAYIGVDILKQYERYKNIALSYDPKYPMSDKEFEEKTSGMFVMISSQQMEREDALPYYFAKEMIEEKFDLGKNLLKFASLDIHNNLAFNGHLLLSFITTIANLELERIFHGTKYNPIDFITELRGINCIVYDDHLKVFEPSAKQKEILKILEMEMPCKLLL
ncbi:MAG: hypothetical protein LBF22_05415 [Deltaproteobacteria bacterium]|nr:hypothetical protein [Deltaproteobacteria bacterium]